MGELSEDLLFGAAKVSEFVGVDTRKVYHWMDRRKNGRDAPPIFDVGGQVCARRSELSSWFSGYRDLSSHGPHTEAAISPEENEAGVISSKPSCNAKISLGSLDSKNEQVGKARE